MRISGCGACWCSSDLEAVYRKLGRYQQQGRAQLQLGMADAAARLDQTEPFGGLEGAFVEHDRRVRVAGAQIGEKLVNGHCGLLKSVASADRRSVGRCPSCKIGRESCRERVCQ